VLCKTGKGEDAMKLGKYCLLALGMAGMLAISMTATTTPAEAGRVGCCWNVCKKWAPVPGTIEARCSVSQKRCRIVSSYRKCYGYGRNGPG
jgi:hypothetical protein